MNELAELLDVTEAEAEAIMARVDNGEMTESDLIKPVLAFLSLLLGGQT